ncbi:hypothetical protein KBX31_03195 [Liquorilactobacillus satsumensis]|uniref:hypothetical protein n=2 Tax=Liquorilactobacillus satsumensis TaxID=259059 RepID=UPI0021C28CC7|nr:hypothetical protein [Liquorilactobacillus satsumensis]MCP9312306.1 hypothetical protein [Liquorilactobacillus satsumensis]MCP9327719.1 hypothetical protein [Liquorilactobacillus satsumensis]MCP9359690.1 hypothetical protein [Liquorilactobacillus satsumensis]
MNTAGFNNNFFRNKYFLNFFMIFLFLVTSFLMVIWFLKVDRLYGANDFSFHASRVQQIFENLRRGSFFTFIATDSFQKTGVGTFLFYPSLFLYPWAFLMLHFSAIHAFYLWYFLFTFVTFLISYFCMLNFSKSPLKSVIFSFLYVVCPYRLYTGQWVLGEFLVSTFLPLVFLGFYAIIKGDYKKWPLLSIGLSLVAYNHILSVFLLLEILTVLFVCKIIFGSGLALKRVLYLGMSALLTLLLVLPVLIPFLSDFVGKGISSTYRSITMLPDASVVFQDSLSNHVIGSSIGTIFLITLLIGWYFIKLDDDQKIFYWVGVGCTLIATSIFPWKSFNNTILATVQLSFRYLMYSSFFLALTATTIIAHLSSSYTFHKFKSFSIYLFSFIFMLLSLLLFYGSTSGICATISTYNPHNSLQKAPQGHPQPIQPAVQLDQKNYHYQFDYSVLFGETDYYPNKALKHKDSIINNLTYIDKKKVHLPVFSSANQLTYKLNLSKKAQVDLPVLAYSQTYLKVNGKSSHYSISNRGTVTKSLSKGFYKLSVGYRPPFLYYLGLTITLCTWLLMTIFFIFKKLHA